MRRLTAPDDRARRSIAVSTTLAAGRRRGRRGAGSSTASAEFWLGELDPRAVAHRAPRPRRRGHRRDRATRGRSCSRPNAALAGPPRRPVHRRSRSRSTACACAAATRSRRRPARGARSRSPSSACPGGRVSSWLHDHLRAGDVLGLGAAAGDFVLPDAGAGAAAPARAAAAASRR